jgi:uncharacterized protein
VTFHYQETAMFHRLLRAALVSSLTLACVGGALAEGVEQPALSVVTGSERGTYIKIGRDLATIVAKPAGLVLKPLVSDGSASNVHRLRKEAGVRLALVQSDVYQAYLDEADAGNAAARHLIQPLRVVMPLYDEEIYFVVRADSPLHFIHEIENKRINVGPIGSGTALTATTLYRQMFSSRMASGNTSHLSNEEALLKLATDASIDVAIIVAGQPATLFSEMRPEARKYIKLLRWNDTAPQAAAALKSYQAATIRASSYPSWLGDDIPTLATKALLVTYDYGLTGGVQQQLVRFAKSLCGNALRLRKEGHPKWQEVSFSLPSLGTGWSYYRPTTRYLAACRPSSMPAANAAVAETLSVAACSEDRRVLALCSSSPAGKR